MTLWIDAQLSPALAVWINREYSEIQARSVRALLPRNHHLGLSCNACI